MFNGKKIIKKINYNNNLSWIIFIIQLDTFELYSITDSGNIKIHIREKGLANNFEDFDINP